ncbi:MAG: NAD(P)(+) transhydrogenase (Re/Si-specific) subunit beta [Clostridiaceae bacterium]
MSELVYYTFCGILIAGVLAGIAMMSQVGSAAYGNALSAVCTAAAIIITLYKYGILSDYLLWFSMAAGLAAGLIGAGRVKMIEMPEAVALLNGFGGAASALVAAITVLEGHEADPFPMLTAGLALGIGMITLTGSLVAGAKLHKLLPQKPIVWKRHPAITAISAILTAAAIAAMVFVRTGSPLLLLLIILGMLVSGFFGVAFAIRVGGADMPITISLLNSLSGVAGTIAGMAISDPLLVAIGGVVGASGLLLTQIMCRAMNRSLVDILLGKTSLYAKPASAKPIHAGIPAVTEEIGDRQGIPDAGQEAEIPEKEASAPNHGKSPSQLLSEAKKVIIVPGYGMALAQAQKLVKKLADKLEANGTDVLFAIHPVAGRMPGHMNVLLCEVDIPYEKLHEMDEINPQFAQCDVAVVIGANDVINPAANTAQGTPIYGMPVLDVGKAKHLIICNYDLKPGYSGVENPLYSKKQGVTLLPGDAKETLSGLLSNL